ncbi:MAG: hypothetical protein AMJ69_09610 [Gammaproteobacteria bacterium SG8_47]|nr:MAG: hypothetical protein AMJ69_09610 [Gammaproteobacteria bacterium SG8_47]
MERLIPFVTTNWHLFLALVAISAMLVWSYLGPRMRGYQSASPAEATQLINHQDAVILDVREDAEYQGGHIINSVHIPLRYLPERLSELERHKGKPIIVGCRSGSRSNRACSLLKRGGFESVYNLAGGVMAWQNANLPMTKR